jgi:hypothetical protein
LLVAGCWLLVVGSKIKGVDLVAAFAAAANNQQPTTNNQQPTTNTCL